MTALDRLLPTPRMIEVDHAEIAASPQAVWNLLRHGDLARSPLAHALFSIRTLPERVAGGHAPLSLRIDDLRSSPDQPGFQVLVDEPPHELCVGAIGKVWHLEIPFVHVADCQAFECFAEPDYAKVAWAVRVSPLGEHDSRVDFELRVDATDDEAWQKFRRYFRLIGPGSHFIRRSILASLERELGTPNARENERPLPGDELLPDATDVVEQITQGVTIGASPEEIWPWLVQMGCRRAGFYSIDWLDNGGAPSAKEIHPELQSLHPGEIIAATPEGTDGFEVLRVEPAHVLVLGGLFDAQQHKQLPFASARPTRYWHVTWAFVLEPLDATRTRLHVRARAAFSRDARWHAAWIAPVHRLMQHSQLTHLAARVEKRLPRDDARDVLDGLFGAARMAFALLTPFLRSARTHHGLSAEEAALSFPGDDLVPKPRWQWTHATTIAASAERIWPWVAQIGADRGGFYSYQWLENLIGCEVHNAEAVHPEWQLTIGDGIRLHPKIPAIPIVELVPNQHLIAFAPPGPAAKPGTFSTVSWAFVLQPIDERNCRLISRYRADCSDDLATMLAAGPALLEPIGFVMDRRMLAGIKERAERSVNA